MNTKQTLHIGNNTEYTKATIQALATAISEILRVGAETRTEQETIRAAIKEMLSVTQVEGTSFSNCNFSGDKTYNHEEEESDEEFIPETDNI